MSPRKERLPSVCFLLCSEHTSESPQALPRQTLRLSGLEPLEAQVPRTLCSFKRTFTTNLQQQQRFVLSECARSEKQQQSVIKLQCWEGSALLVFAMLVFGLMEQTLSAGLGFWAACLHCLSHVRRKKIRHSGTAFRVWCIELDGIEEDGFLVGSEVREGSVSTLPTRTNSDRQDQGLELSN